MNIQSILTSIIVAIAIAFTIRHLWRIFHKDSNSHTGGCACGCDGCSMKKQCS